MGRHVASAAGVLIFAPRAADVITLFQQPEGIDTRAFQGNRHTQTAKACADDRYFVVDVDLRLHPDLAKVAAGKLFLQELDRLARARNDFAFETTLSGLGACRT